MRKIIFFVFVICTMNLGCKDKPPKGAKLHVTILHARDKIVYLETASVSGEAREIIDSAKLESGNATVVFTIAEQEERPFLIRVKDADLLIYVINDTKDIFVKADIIRPDEYTVENSPANAVLRRFSVEQKKILTKAEAIAVKIKESGNANNNTVLKILADSLNKVNQTYHDLFRIFADTVSSPGVFVKIYSQVEFGKDYKGSKAFITKAAARFPNHSIIQQLKEKVYANVKVFEVEYNIGDVLPDVQLPDTAGNQYTTALARGKYVFMDVWSTWCAPCMAYDWYKKKASEKFTTDKLEIISIAFEPDKDVWKQHIYRNRLRWTQLQDSKIWDGETMDKLMIDSIPFNFLLGPDGRILRKAIPADSLLPVLSQYVK